MILPSRLYQISKLFLVEEALGNSVHKLRNKLGAVRKANHVLRQKIEKQANDLWRTEVRVPQLFQMIDDEIEAAETHLQKEIVEIPKGSTPTDAAEVTRSLLASINAEVHLVGFEQKTPLYTKIDPLELELALFCLVENALEAIEGRADGRVELRCERKQSEFTISCWDNGPGLPNAALDPFYTTKPGHLGLGLNIVRRIVSRWGGSVSILSSGDAIALSLPFMAVEAPTKSDKISVLLLDDDDSNRITLGWLLEDEGYKVVEVKSLAEARSAMQQLNYDLAVLDVHLPDGLSTELFPELRALMPSIVIVVMSGSINESVNGAELVLTKTVRPFDIISQITTLMQTKRAR
jgi:CheY-like chemotaxis protein